MISIRTICALEGHALVCSTKAPSTVKTPEIKGTDRRGAGGVSALICFSLGYRSRTCGVDLWFCRIEEG